MKERPDVINGLRQTGVYSLISLLAWQPILVRADVAPTELPKANVDWVSQGAATRVETATDMTVKQISDRVSLQWDTFNIGDKASVKFDQPNSSSIALNRVQGGSGSRINGKLSANGIIYIVDSNGVIFGRNSIVEVASLVATALNVDEDLIMNESFVKAINDGKAAFEGGAGENAAIVLEGSIDGMEGARIITGEGGSVFLFAPRVETQNGSSITTPGGQTILAAAKDQVYLAASQDPDLRGLLVEVNEGGDIDHAGKIVADRGNITLAALNIDQRGQLKATTSVNANGTIRLLARDTVNSIGALDDSTLQNQLLAGVLMADGEVDSDMKAFDAKYAKSSRAGRVTLHEGSVTEVVPESSSKTSADSNVQPVSFVEVMGKAIEVKDRASITSRGGVVSLVATEKPDDPMAVGTPENDASVVLHSGSRIDVSGMDTAVVAMERNSLEIELRGDELKDSPLQRNDADIRGETAFVDIRDTDDIEFADISAYLAKIERTVDERLSAGGKVNVYSEGNVDFQQGAQVDVSGGAVHYKSGYVLESQLVDNGNLVYISDADPNVNYDAVISGNERYNARWNVVEKIKSSSVGAGKGTFVKGYVEGKDAGSFNIKSRAADYGGTVTADTVSGPYQRTGSNQVSGGKIDLDLSHFDFSQQAIALVAESEYQQYLRDKLAGTADAGTTTISVERFAGSADSLSIKTRNDLSLAEGTALTLDGNGALDLKGGDVSIQGDITNRAGAVAIAAAEFQSSNTTSVHTLSVGADVTIDTGGAWINDNPLLGANLNAPVNMDAGAIKLTSDGSVQVAQGANLLANGGAWLNAKGKLQGGKGGDVTVSASRFEYGGTLEYSGNASSHSLEQGGKLTLAGAGFHIGPPAPGVNDNAPGVIQLAADELRAGGFSKLVLDAGLNGIDVADGTRIDLVGEQFRMREGNYRTV
ncbi:MAG: filamentous hemagglutinin N-terminal domain-containing protein, partial [Pseudomonadota bacterium]